MDKIKRRLQSTSGASLLELVVALSIFAIAALVLLRGFTQAAKVNKKSGEYLLATELAQNIMEEVKSNGLETTSLAFNYPIDLTNSGASRFQFLKGRESLIQSGDISIGELVYNEGSKKLEPAILYKEGVVGEKDITSSILSKDNGKAWEFIPRESGTQRSKYYFQVSGLEKDTREFDVLVTFDGSLDSGYKKDDNDYRAEDEKNDYLAPNIEKLNTKENAFLVMEEDWDKEAIQVEMIDKQKEYAQKRWEEDKRAYEHTYPGSSVTFESLYGEKPQGLLYENVWANTKRTLIVSVTEEKGVVKASAYYKFDASHYTDGSHYGAMNLYTSDPHSQSLNFDKLESIPVTFFSTEVGSNLESIYIFYYPNYKTLGKGIFDEIVIENEQNLPFNVYVIKQSKTEGSSTIPSLVQEQQYKMALTVKETPSKNGESNWFTNSGLYRSKVKLLTNINQNISNDSKGTTVNQGSIKYMDSSTNKGLTGTSARRILSMTTLDNKTRKDRIYKVTVEIYRKGAAMQQFKDVKPIVTLESSKDS